MVGIQGGHSLSQNVTGVLDQNAPDIVQTHDQSLDDDVYIRFKLLWLCCGDKHSWTVNLDIIILVSDEESESSMDSGSDTECDFEDDLDLEVQNQLKVTVTYF